MTALARQLWWALEPIHAVVYFGDDSRAAFDAIGLRGFWMGYFASRSAPLGAVGPEVVTALFHGFAPEMVARALPDAWARATPDAVWDARVGLADRSLRPLLDGLPLEGAAVTARAAAEACAAHLAGRALCAAHVGLPWPDEPHLALWHAATILREHRGDGHVAVLTAAGLDGCAANALAAATGRTRSSADQQTSRQWPDDAWAEAVDNLRGRGWLDAEGVATPAGQAARDEIEDRTDRLAWPPYEDVGARLLDLVVPLARRVLDAGAVPIPNPIGLPDLHPATS